MKKLFLLLFLLGTTFFSYSQVSYSLELESFKGRYPKEVYEDICTKLDYFNRHIDENGTLTFQSNNNQLKERIDVIVESFGYKVKSFEMFKDKTEEVIIEK